MIGVAPAGGLETGQGNAPGPLDCGRRVQTDCTACPRSASQTRSAASMIAMLRVQRSRVTGLAIPAVEFFLLRGRRRAFSSLPVPCSVDISANRMLFDQRTGGKSCGRDVIVLGSAVSSVDHAATRLITADQNEGASSAEPWHRPGR